MVIHQAKKKRHKVTSERSKANEIWLSRVPTQEPSEATATRSTIALNDGAAE